MPGFYKKGNKYVGTLQCGAGMDAYLEFELSPTRIQEIERYTVTPLKNGLSDGVDPEQIEKSAIAGTEKAFKITNERYYIKSIGYIPNDSKHYDLHERIVCNIIVRIHDGGEFKEIKQKG